MIRTIARIPGDPAYYEILNALYGLLKTSSHDYQEKNIKRMELNNFTRLHLCSSIYYKFEDNKHTPTSTTFNSEALTMPTYNNR